MRVVIGAWLLGASFLALAAGSSSLGGLVVQGVGTGRGWGDQGFGGPYACESVPFEVTVGYAPGSRAVATFSWASVAASGSNCFVVSNGGVSSLGTLTYDLGAVPPTARWEFYCIGDEAQGLSCGDALRIGPYAGPGSQVWLAQRLPPQFFDGAFVAV